MTKNQTHYRTAIFRSYVLYAEKFHPDLRVKEICKRAGVPRKYLMNPLKWISCEVAVKLTEEFIRETKDNDFPMKAGLFSTSKDVLGPIIGGLGAFQSTEKMYRNVAEFKESFSTITSIDLLSARSGNFTFLFYVTEFGYASVSRDVLERVCQYALDSTVGYLRMVPTLRGNQKAEIFLETLPGESEHELPKTKVTVRFYDSITTMKHIKSHFVALLTASAISYLYHKYSVSEQSLFVFALFAFIFLYVSYFKRAVSEDQTVRMLVESERSASDNYNRIKEQQEATVRLKNSFERFVSNFWVTAMGKSSVEEIALGDAVQWNAAFMFLDLEGFSRISEGMSPKDVLGLLNKIYSMFEPILKSYSGEIESFAGDGMLVVFKDGSNSLQAAKKIVEQFDEYGLERKKYKRPKLGIRIGLNYASSVLGPLGSQVKMQFSNISDGVNVASRLEAFNKKTGTRILFTQEAFGEINDSQKSNSRWIGSFRLQGKEVSTDVFQYFDSDQSKGFAAPEKAIREIVHLMECGDTEALSSFHGRLRKEYPNDPVLDFYREMPTKTIPLKRVA